MQCALVLYFVVTIFVVVYGVPDACVFKDYGGKAALCGRHDVQHIFDYIPPISQYITYLGFRGQPLKQLPYNGFRNVSSLSSISGIVLADCQISYVDAGALLNLHNLTIIDLSHNNINKIDSKLFSDTKQIKLIYMEYNKIEVLPNGLFQNLLQLELVHLQHNQIRQMEWFSFTNTPSLRIIYLNNNQIQFMNMLFKDEFDNLTTLSLHGNPWKCNCELGPLYEFAIKINQLNQYGLVCENPPTLQGRNWNNISRDKFVCHSEDDRTATEHNDNIPVTVHKGMRYQQVDPDIPQLPSSQHWILYTILGLVFVCVTAVIIGVVFLVRHTLAKTKRRHHVRLPTMVKRRSFRRTKAPMRIVRNEAMSENSDSGLNTDDDVDEELTSNQHYELREATIT